MQRETEPLTFWSAAACRRFALRILRQGYGGQGLTQIRQTDLNRRQQRKQSFFLRSLLLKNFSSASICMICGPSLFLVPSFISFRGKKSSRECATRCSVRRCKGKIQSQGNDCQGNGERPFQVHSPDNHCPDCSPASSILQPPTSPWLRLAALRSFAANTEWPGALTTDWDSRIAAKRRKRRINRGPFELLAPFRGNFIVFHPVESSVSRESANRPTRRQTWRLPPAAWAPTP